MTNEPQHLGFLGAAERVLKTEGKPMAYRDITQLALENGWVVTSGKTPEATMNAQISSQLKRQGASSTFVRTGPGVFGLRAWLADGTLDPESEAGPRVFIPYYPIYEQTRAVLPVWDGEPRAMLTGAHNTISSLRGTPQEPQDWTDPDLWIEDRLTGAVKEFALKTWIGSHRHVNPRYMQRNWRLATNHALLSEDAGGHLRLTGRGRDFVDNESGSAVQEIDDREGLLELLALVAELGPAARADLLAPFGEFIRSESRLRSDSAIKAALWSRLRNLTLRDLVERAGNSYETTSEGLDYLERAGGKVEPTLEQQIRRLLADQKEQIRSQIHEMLSEMDPFAFEHFIKRLLEELGYEEVEVTARAGDKGVDVVGRIDMGITSVREVIQVKRQKGNIARPVLDSLRGVLHRFDAVRGTIITTGGFTKGTREASFERGAAPVTLIDGERLLDLLTEHSLGVKRKKAELWELDSDAFTGLLVDELDEAEDA